MEILDHTNEHSPTLMRDIFETLIGEQVVVWTSSSFPLSGKLSAYNGIVIQLTDDVGIKNTYLSIEKVVAISSNK